VIGGFYRFRSDQGPDDQELKHRQLVEKCKDLDITFTGIIRQDEIAAILAKASYMMYPSAFPETFGISTLESLAYNTPLITCRNGALEETAIEAASYKLLYSIEPNVLYTEIDLNSQCQKFVELANQVYRTPYIHQQKMYACNQVKDICTWDTVALQWKQHFYKKLNANLPVEEYRKVKAINERVRKVFNRSFINAEERLEHFDNDFEKGMSIIVPVYNAEAYIERCLTSIFTQDYTNYTVYVINDASTDRTKDIIQNFKVNLAHPEDLIIINNEKNMGAVYNQINTIKSYVNGGDIVVLVDGDDWLANDPTIFKRINNIYSEGAAFTYGSCWSLVDSIPLVAQPYPEHVKKEKSYRSYKFNWGMPYTHLRTFYAYLVDVPDSTFQDEKGNSIGDEGKTPLKK
jgi:hypothetical protein